MTVTEPADIAPPPPPPAEPHPALRTLEPLVGTWTVSSGSEESGTQTFEWMEGGFFLIHRTDLGGKGIEIIGYDEQAGVCTSNYFDSSGNRFTYAWELSGDSLRVWMGAKGSPAGFTGTLSDGGRTITGDWEWPGGGYSSVSTKVD